MAHLFNRLRQLRCILADMGERGLCLEQASSPRKALLVEGPDPLLGQASMCQSQDGAGQRSSTGGYLSALSIPVPICKVLSLAFYEQTVECSGDNAYIRIDINIFIPGLL